MYRTLGLNFPINYKLFKITKTYKEMTGKRVMLTIQEKLCIIEQTAENENIKQIFPRFSSKI